MFGKILSAHEYNIAVQNITGKVESNLLGVHVVFEDKYKIVGEISKVDFDKYEIVLIGEISNGKFIDCLNHKPSSNSMVRIVNKDEVALLVGEQAVDTPTALYIGKSTIYDGFNVSANINNFFSNHFAIIGNSGSGKSCTVTRIFQNLFYRSSYIPSNARFVLFDVYGEYHKALEKINQTKYCRCKTLTTDIHATKSSIIKFPSFFLEEDDIALLLDVDSPAQLPIISKALKYVYLFTEEESKVIAFKNNIIAKALLDILTSGKEPSQIRDQVVAVLTTFNTKDINLDSEIVQPGYIRTLRQCLNLDQTGKINAISLIIEFIEGFIDENLKLNKSMKPKMYTLKDLHNAFEFALISEGVLKSDKVYDVNNILKVRLENIINGDYEMYFNVDNYISKEQYIKDLFTTSKGEQVQIVNFNLNYVDERFAKALTKIYSKLFLNYCYTLENNNGFDIHIVLEEAHRYVQNDTDTAILGYNIFDRITKEGRKYGVILGLITQRPSEISTTSLSQCSNYIVLRMFHPDDLNIVKNITHSISGNDVERLKSLSPGTALCFGNAFNIPMFAKIDKPDPTPSSGNVEVASHWFKKAEELEVQRVMNSSDIQKSTIEIFQ